MADPVRVLISIGQALASMRFYDERHPARLRTIESSFTEILDLLAADTEPRFLFLEGESVYGPTVLRELDGWEWATRLEKAGIQRLEFSPGVTIEDYERFLADISERLAGSPTASASALMPDESAIRYGAVGLRDGATTTPEFLARARGLRTLEAEVAAVQWIHEEVRSQRQVPLLEADVVVRSLTHALHQESRIVLPLLQLKEYDQYTTTHACNVAVLATALAERTGCDAAQARALGVCGLLHDIGKVRIPHDVLTKPGRLTDQERLIIEQHPVDGARILIEHERNLDLAAIVSFEHHRWLDQRGYPQIRYDDHTHPASRLIQVCDVFDALCTNRPYRPGMPADVALRLLEEEAGSHFEPELVRAFAAMIRDAEIATLQPTGLAEPGLAATDAGAIP